MSAPNVELPVRTQIDREELAQQPSTIAAKLYDAVAEAYLQFRRTYYHEELPSLATTPPAQAEMHKAEIALLAENTLRLVPQAVKTLPVVGGFVEHLQQVADLNSLSEAELATLHNMTMAFLYGIKGGIQPWYVEWALASARRLASVDDPNYFMTYSWDACLYFAPDDLLRLEHDVSVGDLPGIERAMQQIAERLMTALSNPIDAQVEFAFTGPDADQRRMTFRLKTAACVALGAYLVTEEVRTLLHPREQRGMPSSALAPLPPELIAHQTSAGADSSQP
ncbi:MAG TPA: hypothetical protein VGF38_15745 [Ktedonobacterales bacterium]|jgi:hypothetical protein